MVFATILSEGYINEPNVPEAKCMFNQTESACNYGVGVGILAFLACVVFIVLDALFHQISNARERKYIVLGDLVFSGTKYYRFFYDLCFKCHIFASI